MFNIKEEMKRKTLIYSYCVCLRFVSAASSISSYKRDKQTTICCVNSLMFETEQILTRKCKLTLIRHCRDIFEHIVDTIQRKKKLKKPIYSYTHAKFVEKIKT